MSRQKNIFKDAKKKLQTLQKNLPRQIGALVVQEVNKNFTVRQGFFQKGGWIDRKNKKGNRGKHILVQSGDLRRATKYQAFGSRVVITNHTKYAQIHNEGGLIKNKVSVREHTRKRKKKGKKKKEKVNVIEHPRQMNTTIPKRQFIGEHPLLTKKIKYMIKKKLDKAFKR